jgi:hypothetical protein
MLTRLLVTCWRENLGIRALLRVKLNTPPTVEYQWVAGVRAASSPEECYKRRIRKDEVLFRVKNAIICTPDNAHQDWSAREETVMETELSDSCKCVAMESKTYGIGSEPRHEKPKTISLEKGVAGDLDKLERDTILRLRALPPGYPNRQEWDEALSQAGAEPFPEDDRDDSRESQHLAEDLERVWKQMEDPNQELRGDISAGGITQKLEHLFNMGDGFKAGQLHTRRKVWKRYLQLANVKTELAITIMQCLKDGVPLLPIDPSHPQKVREPNHEKKGDAVRRILLRNGVPYCTAEEMLKGEAIQPVVLENTL